jgi:hypothetical protein
MIRLPGKHKFKLKAPVLTLNAATFADHNAISTLLITTPAHQYSPMRHDAQNSARGRDITGESVGIMRGCQLVTPPKLELQ